MWYQQNEQTDKNIECQVQGKKGSLMKEYHSSNPFSWGVYSAIIRQCSCEINLLHRSGSNPIEFLHRNYSAVLVQNDHYSSLQI